MTNDSENQSVTSREEVEELLVNEAQSFYSSRRGRFLLAVTVGAACFSIVTALIDLFTESGNKAGPVVVIVAATVILTVFLLVRATDKNFCVEHNYNVAEHNLTVFERYRESLQEKRLLFSRTPSTVAGLSSLDQLEAEIREADNEINRRRERVAYHHAHQRGSHRESTENLENEE